MPRVFVTDGQARSSLTVVRSLGRKGFEIVVGESSRTALAFFSKYCKKSVVYPCPKSNPEAFIEFMINHLRSNSYDVVFPMDDVTIAILSRYKQELSQYTKLPIADFQTIMKARDKSKTMKIATEYGIPCPLTFNVHDFSQLKGIKEKLELPVVIKPKESSGSRGILYVRSKDMLEEAYKRVHKVYPWPIIQEYIPTRENKLHVCALFNEKAEPIAHFQQRIIREYPVNGGVGTLWESIYDADILSLGLRLFRAFQWYGIVMAEFIIDSRDGKPKLMEINPRFWNTLALAVQCGVDFPYLLFRLAMDPDMGPVKIEYELGKRARWLLPGDFLHFLSNPDRFKLKPSFFQFFNKGTTHVMFQPDDPLPVLGFFVVALRFMLNMEKWRHVLRKI